MKKYAETIEEMRRYYRARAPEYDDWYFRRNSYDKGNSLNRLWIHELKTLRRYSRLIKGHHILEVAAGTGMWTQYLLENNTVTPVDASPEALSINYRRTGLKGVIGDAFELSSHKGGGYDLCFLAFWLSHVPLQLVDGFFRDIARTIAPGGRVVIFDSVYNGSELNCLSHENDIQVRSLKSGEAYKVYKRYYSSFALRSLAGRFFRNHSLLLTSNYFFILDGQLRTEFT